MDFRSTLRLAVWALLFAALPVGAALYKWTDENGRVVYGDTPPAGVKAERINATVPPADPSALRDMAAKDAQINKRQQERTEAEAKADKAAAEEKARLERCVQARGRWQTLKSETAVYRYNENGDKVYYEPAERDKAIADTEKTLRDLNCPSAPAG